VGRPYSAKPTDDTDGDDENGRGTKRKTDTQENTTDPDSRLDRKSEGMESTRCSMRHATREHRNGLAVAGLVSQARGIGGDAGAERIAPYTHHGRRGQGLDVEEPVDRLWAKHITPHLAVNAYGAKTGQTRKTSLDGRITRHKDDDISQGNPKMIECILGWDQPHGTMRKPKHRDLAGVPARLSAQSDRLQPHPHPETAGTDGIGASKNTKRPDTP
jgi:hypothetical protein